MGYYTRYSLEIIGEEENASEPLLQELKKYGITIPSSVDHEKAISELAGYGSVWEGELKWYGHEGDMRVYSENYPFLVFKLTGEGEESGDIWVKYFKNGKMQESKAKIVLDEYDESELK